MPAKGFDLIPCTDVSYFYSNESSSAIEQRCIGHLRLDFGDGEEFWTSWWPHTADDANDAAFKAEFNALVGQLRKNLFKSRCHMYKYLADYPTPPLEGDFPRSYSSVTKIIGNYAKTSPDCIFQLFCHNEDEDWYQQIHFRGDDCEALDGHIVYDPPQRIHYDMPEMSKEV